MALRSIWNRICQFGCSCPSCNARSALNTRGRSAYETAQSRPFTSSTLVYTVAFGCATAIDGDRRIRRREQWDEAIAEKKTEIAKLEESMTLKKKNILKKRLQSTKFSKTLRQNIGSSWEAELLVDPALADKEARLATIEREKTTGDRLIVFNDATVGDSTISQVPVIPVTAPISPYHLPPQSIWSTEKIRSMGRKITWTSKKTYGVELCMTRLTLELCLATGLSDISGDELASIPPKIQPFAALSKDEAETVARQIELELTSLMVLAPNGAARRANLSVPLPKYKAKEAANQNETIDFTNKQLWKICDETTTPDSSSIAKICEQIINSTASPDLKTINCLLLAFNRWRRPDLAKSAVSVVYDGRFRPNEITCASILRHYRQTDDRARFLEYINLMGGGRTGLMLAKPWFKTTSNIKTPRLIPMGNKLIQAITPSALTYLEMTLGLAKYVGLEQTWLFCKELATQGWGLDHANMYLLLFRSSVESVTSLYQEIWQEAEKLSASGHRIPQSLYALMIAIHKLDESQEKAWTVFEDSAYTYPGEELKILGMVQKRSKLIKETRIAEDNVKEAEYSRLEQDTLSLMSEKDKTLINT